MDMVNGVGCDRVCCNRVGRDRVGELSGVLHTEKKTMRTPWLGLLFVFVVPGVLPAQDGRILYYPKPDVRTAYEPPMKPVTRLAELKEMHAGERRWRERI